MLTKRLCYIIDPDDFAKMFGEGRLVDVRFDHERRQVEVVVEGAGEEWIPGNTAFRVRAKPLPTAYVMPVNETGEPWRR